MIIWDAVLEKLRADPSGTHELLEPIDVPSIESVEQELGQMPDALKAMLLRFNGARLFCRSNGGGELVTLFGLLPKRKPDPFDWADDWFIDVFTRKWRAQRAGRQEDWVIGVMNYGGILVMDGGGFVHEWDSAVGKWIDVRVDFAEWLSRLLGEGAEFMEE